MEPETIRPLGWVAVAAMTAYAVRTLLQQFLSDTFNRRDDDGDDN